MRRFLRSAIVLGLITAVGPFAIDMYLPALPSIGGSLSATPAQVQASLMAFFFTLGLCQLLYGPLTDMVGRKLPIYGGLVVFIIGSVGCACAPDVRVLIAFRVLQAFGACAGMVVPRAIVRDLHTGHDATRLMSLLMLVVSISPILAPITGSVVIAAFGWRGVFWTLTGAAVLALILAATQLRETRPASARDDSSWGKAFYSYWRLCRDLPFVAMTLVGTFGISSFFVFLAGASFVLIRYYGLSPSGFSLCFGLNAASFFGVSQLAGPLTARYGLAGVMRGATIVFTVAMCAMAAIVTAGMDRLAVMMGFLMVGFGALGLILPTSAVAALDRHGENAGTASALGGAIQMVTGAAIMALAGTFADGTPRPMALGIAGCAVLTFVTAHFALRGSPRHAPPSHST